MEVQTSLYFEGRAEEAIEFYRRALGAEVKTLMRFKDVPADAQADCPGGKTPPAEKIMHADIRIGDTRILISDGDCTGKPLFQGFGLAITAANSSQVDQFFNALAEGGRIVMPPDKTFFSPRFGMLTDRFGVSWMILALKQ
jgi:PhnB protein